MRFKQFILNEADKAAVTDDGMAELMARLKRECTPFLEMNSGALLRGIRRIGDDKFGQNLHEHPRNRTSVNSSDGFVQLFNAMAQVGVGTKNIRSHSIFAIGRAGTAANYGDIQLIFPRGPTEFIWSPRIWDSYVHDATLYTSVDSKASAALEKAGVQMSPAWVHPFFDDMDDAAAWLKAGDEADTRERLHVAHSKSARSSSAGRVEIPDSVKVFPILKAALLATFNDYYSDTSLDKAVASENEILIYESDGYYAVPASTIVWQYYASHHGIALSKAQLEDKSDESEPIAYAYKWFIGRLRNSGAK